MNVDPVRWVEQIKFQQLIHLENVCDLDFQEISTTATPADCFKTSDSREEIQLSIHIAKTLRTTFSRILCGNFSENIEWLFIEYN